MKEFWKSDDLIEKIKSKIWADDYWHDSAVDKLLPHQLNRFARLIVLECCELAKSEIIDDIDIETEYDPAVREYFKGNNTGVVDVICTIKEQFGVE